MATPSGETWTLLAIAWGTNEALNASRAASIFGQSEDGEARPCPVPGVTLLAYRSVAGAVVDAMRVVDQAQAKVALVTGECGASDVVGFSGLSSRLYSLLNVIPANVVICALSTFESIRHTSSNEFIFTDLGPVGLPDIGGRERVFQVTHESAPLVTVTIDSAERVIDTIPSRFGYFVGRTPELDRCFLYLEQKKNVTITGLAGIGKSHFACRVAREVRGSYASGVAWVALEGAKTLEDIVAAIAKGLCLGSMAEKVETVRRILREEQLLVVLDGAEGCSEALVDMLSSQLWGATSQFLITSTHPLGYENEEVVALAPMTTPPPDLAPTLEELYEFESTALFLDRVEDLNENLLGYVEASAVASLAQALVGHPQAICLAAAQTRFDSVEMILAGLATDAEKPGHRKAVSGSLSGLPKQAQHVALALSICETPISAFQLARLDPEYSVDPSSLDLLLKAGLCGETISPSGRITYELYPSVKMHIRRSPAAGRRTLQKLHESLFVELIKDAVEGHGLSVRSGDLDIAEEQAPDIFLALRSLSKHISADTFYVQVRDIYPFFYDHNHINECLTLIDEIIVSAGPDESFGVAKLMNLAATLANKAGRAKRARELCEQGLSHLGACDNGVFRSALITTLATVEWSDGNSELAREQFAFAIDLTDHLGRNDMIASPLVSSVIPNIECGDFAAAENALARAMSIWTSPTTLQKYCFALGQGQVEWAKAHYSAAKAHVSEAIRIAQEMNDQLSLLRSLIWLAQVLGDDRAASASTHVLAVAAHNQTEQVYRLHRANEMRVEQLRQCLIEQLGESNYRKEFVAGSMQSLDQVLASIY